MSPVAQTIVDQIGSRAFLMLGTQRDIWTDGDSLIFRIRGCESWSQVKVTLAPDNTYIVRFYNLRNGRVKIKELTGVLVGNLHEVLESETGLFLALTPRS